MAAEASGRPTMVDEDPLVAALPPATDYLTYLTLLEYQLKPSNLSTLNRLLDDDDGKLVGEIGWDLLRLVLPMFTEVPLDAANCLQIIARKGNPREVVVRVAEELEKLGEFDDSHADGDDEDDEDDNEEVEELPTFAGEATRIHLGQMTLDGMPEIRSNSNQDHDQSEKPQIHQDGKAVQQDSIIFHALLSTLSTIHPRIRTQYPSRFLATSLPAALGAYRRIPITIDTTKDFLNCLRTLSGRQRPALPPRMSTAGDSTSLTGKSAPEITAPLPDPEAAAEAEEGVIIASETEKSIIHRLLQAVLLEIMDDYFSSLQHQQTACMHWTNRLREKLEPKRVVPGKKTEQEKWQSEPDLKARDALMSEFLALANQLGLQPIKELRVVTGQDEGSTELAEEEEEEVSEYPRSSSDIPFPTTGLIQLAAATIFAVGWTAEVGDLNTPLLFKLTQILSEKPLLPNSCVQDALCSLLYQNISRPGSNPTRPLPGPDFKILMAMLTQTFTISPDAQTRDDAHHISTKLLHHREAMADRIDVIMQTVRCTYLPPENAPVPLSPPYSEGTLKAIGIDWLKNEMATNMRNTEPNDEVGGVSLPGGINPEILESDQELSALIFPPIPTRPTVEEVDPDMTTLMLLSLPFYISILNLACVLFSGASVERLPTTFKKCQVLLASLNSWKEYLLDEMIKDEAVKDSASDIFALEDACSRAKAVLAKKESVAGVAEAG